MERKTIELRSADDVEPEADALVRGPLALHLASGADQGVAITHVPSGLRVGPPTSLGRAWELLGRLSALPWHLVDEDGRTPPTLANRIRDALQAVS